MLPSGEKAGRRQRVSSDLDKLSAIEIARLMNRQDSVVVEAVGKALPAIAKAIDLASDRLARGGRLIYVGSGTSGRIGALDAAECPPTFGSAPEMIQYVIAGGEAALGKAIESGEDSAELGASDIAARKPGKRDVVVGVSATGRTRYTIAALKHARKKGAATIAVVCSRGSELAQLAELAIEAVVGPEVLAGSTRLKAGTAEKMICNMLTTGAMARLGYVYGNLMVHVQMKNQKLIERGIAIVQSVAGVARTVAIRTLEATEGNVPVAMIMLCAGVTKAEAMRRLKRTKGNVRRAMEG